MVDAFNEKLSKVLETIQRKGDDVLKTVDGKRDDVLDTIDGKRNDVLDTIDGKRDDALETIRKQKDEVQNYKDNATMNSTLTAFHEDLVTHLQTKFQNVPISPLLQSHVKPIKDFFVSPDIRHISKDGRTTGGMLHKYKDIFYKSRKLNRRIYLQGDPGKGKSTFTAKLILDWCQIKLSPMEAGNPDIDFDDVETLQEFKYVFHIALRYTAGLRTVVEMIKSQIIDQMYPDGERNYRLLNLILKTEKCLVVIDALDDWADPKKEIAIPFIETTLIRCVVLTTTRPYKLVDQRIDDSYIDSLIELKGIADPAKLVKLILNCNKNPQPDIVTKKFMDYVSERRLGKYLESPMLLTLLVCLWNEGIILNGSLCDIQCNLLDYLFKKVHDPDHRTYFQTPPFRCFDKTCYLHDVMDVLDVLAEAAFHFLYENKLVFTERELCKYMKRDQIQVSLRAGVLTERRCFSKAVAYSSISFLHKTLQEFLSAYYIAKDSKKQPSDRIVPYRCLSVNHTELVFVHLCGLDIVTATTVSCEFNSEKVKVCRASMFNQSQTMVISGYNEAEANQQCNINLHLKDFNFDEYVSDHDTDKLKMLLSNNASNVRSLVLDRYVLNANDIFNIMILSAQCIVHLKISKCIGLGFKDLNNSAQLSKMLPTLVNMSDFEINEWDIKAREVSLPDSIRSFVLVSCHFQSHWLLSVILKLSNIGQHVQCTLHDCVVDTSEESQQIYSRTSDSELGLKQAFDMPIVSLKICQDSPGLYEFLRDLGIQRLELESVHNDELLLQTLPSLTKLKTFTLIRTQLESLNIKLHQSLESLCLRWISCSPIWLYTLLMHLSNMDHVVRCTLEACDVKPSDITSRDNTQVLYSDSNQNADITSLELIVVNDSPGLYEALRHMPFRTLTFTSVNMALVSKSLHTLTTLREMYLHDTNFNSSDFNFPSCLEIISLNRCSSSLTVLKSLLDKLSALGHPVRCELKYYDWTLSEAFEQMAMSATISQSNVDVVIEDSPGLYNELFGISTTEIYTRTNERPDVPANIVERDELFGKLGIDFQFECGLGGLPAFSHSCAELQKIVERAKAKCGLDERVFEHIDYTLVNSKSIQIYSETSLLQELKEAIDVVPTVTNDCFIKEFVGQPILVIVRKEKQRFVEEWIGASRENNAGICFLLLAPGEDNTYIPPRRNIFVKYSADSNIKASANDILERMVFFMLKQLIERCKSMYDILEDTSDTTETLVELYTCAKHAYGRSEIPFREQPCIPEIPYPDHIDSVIAEVLNVKGVFGCSKTRGKLEVCIDDNDYKNVQEQVKHITIQRNIKTIYERCKFTFFFSAGDKICSGTPSRSTLGGFAVRTYVSNPQDKYGACSNTKKLVALVARHAARIDSVESRFEIRVGDKLIGSTDSIHNEPMLDILPIDVYDECVKHCDTRFRTEDGKSMFGTLIGLEKRDYLTKGTLVHIWGAASSPGLGIIEGIMDVSGGLLITIQDRITGCPFANKGDSGAIICALDARGQTLYAIAMLIGTLQSRSSESHSRYVGVLLEESFQKLALIYSSEFRLCCE
ncbi:uncharacterized protein LOC127853982 [Dreissena polymorpha]|nr:uncharacterized protein LOC127853982 [Dreissena polymorpha]